MPSVRRYDPKSRQIFGKLMKFLGLPKDTPRLKRAIRHSSFQVVSQQETKKVLLNSPEPDINFSGKER